MPLRKLSGDPWSNSGSKVSLRGEEGIECVAQVFRSDAAPDVIHDDLKTILLRLFGLRCQNRSPASLRHRIDGLRYHIREDLNDFSGMSADLLQIIICGIDDEVMGKQPAPLHREDRGLLNGKPV
jgi:hypothetical protein